MSFGIYLTGYLIFVAGLALAAHLLGLPPLWIVVGILILLGMGLASGASYTGGDEGPTGA